MSVDPITEFISHFIGIFSVTVEQARMRLEYEEFVALTSQDVEQSELVNINVKVYSPHELKDYIPDVAYSPDAHYVEPLFVDSNVYFNLPQIYIPHDLIYSEANGINQFPFYAGFDGANALLNIPLPPGSLALVLNQNNYLYDHDFYSNAENYTGFDFNYSHAGTLNTLLESADNYGFTADLNPPKSEDAISEIIEQIAFEANEFVNTLQPDEICTVFSGSDVLGVHVNGQTATQAPLLSDHLPPAHQPQEDTTDTSQPVSHVNGEGPLEFDTSISVEAGANILINQVSITSVWNTSAVVAVTGDSHNLDLISQINIWNDTDTVHEMLMANDAQDATQTQGYNIAQIVVTARDIQTETELQSEDLVFPTQWTVTRLDGDLVFLNWVEQKNFVSDNDSHVFTNSGTQTQLITGDNTAINSLSLFDLGIQYDLIVVGGSYYNANIILQTNIMLDNDFLHIDGNVGSDFDYSSSGNLLWNQATIESFGTTNFDALPDNFVQLAQSLANGSNAIGQDILTDALFTGLAGLNVLYIDGDILDLQYIDQTNILGDSDEVSILANDYAENSGVDWDISTGGNAVINVATIVDVAADQTILVGGDQYSDELIIQAELVPEISMQNNDDALVSEAVIFLVDDMLESENSQNPSLHVANAQDTSDVDLMQTMLS